MDATDRHALGLMSDPQGAGDVAPFKTVCEVHPVTLKTQSGSRGIALLIL